MLPMILAGAWVVIVVLVLAMLRSAARADAQHARQARHWVETGKRGSAVGLVTAASVLAAQPPARASGCAAGATDASPARTRAAITCRIGELRDNHGAQRLHVAKRLSQAAGQYAADMAERDFFAHVSPEGARLRDRVLDAHWVTERCAWHVGEVLAWGTGDDAGAAWIVRAWMHSPEHRRILLGQDYDEIGVGAARGAPVPTTDGTPAITVAALLGTRDCPAPTQ